MKTDMDYIAEQCAEIDRRQGVKPTSSCMVDSVVVLSDLAVKIYNAGYRAGHEDTCEGRYVDVMECDTATYHDDIVKEIISEHNADLTGKQKPEKEVSNV